MDTPCQHPDAELDFPLLYVGELMDLVRESRVALFQREMVWKESRSCDHAIHPFTRKDSWTPPSPSCLLLLTGIDLFFMILQIRSIANLLLL